MGYESTYAPVVALDSYRKQPCAKVGALRLVPDEGKAVTYRHRWLALPALVFALGGAFGASRLVSGETSARAQPLPPVTVTSVVYLPEMRQPMSPLRADLPVSCPAAGCPAVLNRA